MTTILIADSHAQGSFMQNLLSPKHETTTVMTMNEITVALRTGKFDLVMIDLRFDESRMFEAMQLTKSSPNNSDTPIICFGDLAAQLLPAVNESLTFTARALGAWMFLDVHEYNQTQDPKAELLRVIERCLVGAARKATQAARLDLHNERQEIQRLRMQIQNEPWSPEFEQRLVDLRKQLTALLLKHCELQLQTFSQQEAIDESRDLGDRVPDAVTKMEDKATRVERKQAIEEVHNAADESSMAEREEDLKKQAASKPRNHTD